MRELILMRFATVYLPVPDGSAVLSNFRHRPLPRPIESLVDYAKFQVVLLNDHYGDKAPKMRRTSRWQRTRDPGPAVGLVGGLDISVTRSSLFVGVAQD